MNKFLLPALLMTVPFAAQASCDCVCVNGRVQQLCDTAYDIPAFCAAQICPIAEPPIRPIMPPTIPPIGTTSCGPEQVFNPLTGQYEWHVVCN